MKVLVTGGAGFIGTNLVQSLVATGHDVVVLDKLTYAANPTAIDPRVTLARGDIADRGLVRDLLATTRPDAIAHLAAESHVDRSIDAPEAFVTTNITGTFALLEETRRYLAGGAPRAFRFLHVSTDEVFGSLGADGVFVETSRYAPRSPYAASKAASDHLVASYVHTYGFPAIVTNCTNNYGPYQYPEKLIPLTIHRALARLPLPVYGTGTNVRDWIFVADHCAALRALLERGRLGETYLIGARCERTNLELDHQICALLDELRTAAPYRDLVAFVADRPGHDFRYAIDPAKLERELDWRPTTSFDAGLRRTVEWYLSTRR